MSALAKTRPQARQIVNHSHIQVNGKKVNIPSFHVKAGDVVTVKERSKDILVIRHAADTAGDRLAPEWLDVNLDERRIIVRDVPSRAQIDTAIKEQLVVELYSK